MDEKAKELAELVDELVAKGGPTTGQIKANQDPDKVARLIELGWTPSKKEVNGVEIRLKEIEDAQKKILKVLIDHEKRINECSIQR